MEMGDESESKICFLAQFTDKVIRAIINTRKIEKAKIAAECFNKRPEFSATDGRGE